MQRRCVRHVDPLRLAAEIADEPPVALAAARANPVFAAQLREERLERALIEQELTDLEADLAPKIARQLGMTTDEATAWLRSDAVDAYLAEQGC